MDKPILFSSEMVRAILDGRKTMTRRLDKRWLKIKKGDRLWVKETWCPLERYDWVGQKREENVNYKADSTPCGESMRVEMGYIWKSSRFMPRWASRITLEATEDARLEMLQEMTTMDLIKEGMVTNLREYDAVCYLRSNFQKLWDPLNPKALWKDNPEVVVLEFNLLKRK